MDVAITISIIGVTACCIAFTVAVCRLLWRIGDFKFPTHILEKWVGSKSTSVSRFAPKKEASSRSKTHDMEVESPPPEVIAPKLQKPPRSPGGFGSRAVDVDVEDE